MQHYSTEPSFTPSSVHISTPARSGATPGDFFLAPYQGQGSPGPMIVEQGGNLVWFHPLPANDSATNFKVQEYEGRPVLTWWQGRILEVGFGQGEDVLYDTSYQPVATCQGGQRLPRGPPRDPPGPRRHRLDRHVRPDQGEPQPLPRALNGVISDSVVQEIDIRTAW